MQSFQVKQDSFFHKQNSECTLPSDAVEAKSVNSFKARIDKKYIT